MASAQSQTRQQEIDEYDTDKMPTIADIDEIYTLTQLDDRMRLTLDRVSNLLARLEENDARAVEKGEQNVLNKLETWLNTPANEDDDVMDFILDGLGVKIYTKEDWRELQEEKEFVRAMQTDVCCVGCGERVCGFTEEPPHKDRKGEAVCDDCCEDCECGNNREKGYDSKGNMRCEDCDIDGPNYNGGLTDDEDEDDEPQHDICCGCGKYDDTRPVCDCGGSHRSNCAECSNDQDEDDPANKITYEEWVELTGNELDDFTRETVAGMTNELHINAWNRVWAK